jgi:hypothetical protein
MSAEKSDTKLVNFSRAGRSLANVSAPNLGSANFLTQKFMAEALGVAEAQDEKENQENIFAPEAPEEIEEIEPQQQAETEKPQPYHFHDTDNHFEGMVVFGASGNVVDYVGNFGSMRTACEANPAGAPIEKVLALYQEVINKNGAAVEKRFPDPENASVTIVHTLTRVGYDRIVISITREKVQPEVEQKSEKLSPAELSQKVLIETAWKMTVVQVEIPHGEPAHVERVGRVEKVTSTESARVVHAASASGIRLEGLPAEGELQPFAAVQHQPTASLGNLIEFSGGKPDENQPATAESAPAQALGALKFLRAA